MRENFCLSHCVRWNYETSTINNSLLRLSYANRKKFNLTENNNSFVEKEKYPKEFQFQDETKLRRFSVYEARFHFSCSIPNKIKDFEILGS